MLLDRNNTVILLEDARNSAASHDGTGVGYLSIQDLCMTDRDGWPNYKLGCRCGPGRQVERITADLLRYGSKFAARSVALCVYANKVSLDFSRPDEPTDNASSELLNESFREANLNEHKLKDLTWPREQVQAFKKNYHKNLPYCYSNNPTL